MARKLWLPAVFLAWLPLAVPADRLTPQEKRGKQIYLRGITHDGKEIMASLGDPPIEVPGSLMACANCHDHDGRGKPEGGVSPSDISWGTLSKSYGVTHDNGRKHPAYSDETLARAIRGGVDPAGGRLQLSMPRFTIAAGDMSDLLAYLKQVGTDTDQGLTDSSITIGTLVPGEGQLAGVGEAIRSVLAGYLEDVNQQGGIYSRRIELRIAQVGSSPEDTRKRAERFVDVAQVFAMAGAFIAGADRELAGLMRDKEVPLIGPLALNPQVQYPLNRQVFYLYPGMTEQGRALVCFAAAQLKLVKPAAAVVYPEGEVTEAIAAAIEEEARNAGWPGVRKIPYPRAVFSAAQVAMELSSSNTEAVFFLGDGVHEPALALEAGKRDWKPYLFVPGALAGRDLLSTPSSFNGQLYASFPMLPSDQTSEGIQEYRRFAEKHQLTQDHLASRFSAYCAAKVLVEGLKLAGRELTREKLITALEGMYRYETGLSPPLTFGPNRRVGALGAHVMKVDLEKKDLVPAGEWVQVR